MVLDIRAKHIRDIDTSFNSSRNYSGAVVFDGDGDGTSAAAIWLMNTPGENYLAITNRQKNDRTLVKKLIVERSLDYWNDKNIGIFDIDAEQNQSALETIAQTRANIQFFDHHTRNLSIIPNSIESYVEKDSRNNCTATITYDKFLEQLDTKAKKLKAAQLAVIGLSNDGKKIDEKYLDGIKTKDLDDLAKYARAINFGAGSGRLDSIFLLQEFMIWDKPIDILRGLPTIADLVNLREKALTGLLARSWKFSDNGIQLYVLPHTTPLDKETSLCSYNELITSFMEKDSSGLYAVALKLPDDNWRVTFRCADESRNVYNVAQSLAQQYDGLVVGRSTAAGFGTTQEIKPKTLWNQILEVAR